MEKSGDKTFNVLHVVSKLPIGGVENMLLNEVKGYDDSRFNVSVCCIKEGGKIADELKKLGFNVEILYKMKGHGFDFGAVKSIYNLIKRKNIHILRTHQYHANLYGRIAGILAGVPVIIPIFQNVYESPNKPKFHRRVFNHILALFSDSLIAVSNAVASDIIRFDWVSPKKIKLIYNNVVLENFNTHFSKQEARKIFNLPLNDTLIGTVGRLTKQKGHRYLIEAASKLGDGRIVIAGDGPLSKELKELADKYKVNCIFMGLVNPDRISLFLKALDIYCFPSLWEGLGIALAEALAAGLPVVASDILPHKELVHDAGILVPSEDTDRIVKALKILIDNPALRDTLGKKSRERAKAFSIDNTVKAYDDIFKEILRKKRLL